MNVESVAERIKRLRTARGLTQESLARSLNVAVATVARWESTTRGVVPLRVYRRSLAEALGVGVDELLGVERESLPPASRPRPDRRLPVLQPLRDLVSHIQSTGEDVLADFVSDVVDLASDDRYSRKRSR